MMRRLERSADNVVGYSLSGEVTDQEFTQTASELKDDIARGVADVLPDIETRTYSHADETEAWAWLE